MKIQQSAEDYLEAMLVLQEKYGYIRSIDIAKYLGVTKPSVSYAVVKCPSAKKSSPVAVGSPGKCTDVFRRSYAGVST